MLIFTFLACSGFVFLPELPTPGQSEDTGAPELHLQRFGAFPTFPGDDTQEPLDTSEPQDTQEPLDTGDTGQIPEDVPEVLNTPFGAPPYDVIEVSTATQLGFPISAPVGIYSFTCSELGEVPLWVDAAVRGPVGGSPCAFAPVVPRVLDNGGEYQVCLQISPDGQEHTAVCELITTGGTVQAQVVLHGR